MKVGDLVEINNGGVRKGTLGLITKVVIESAPAQEPNTRPGDDFYIYEVQICGAPHRLVRSAARGLKVIDENR